ncbi:hypothetical protein DFH06DRAFT_311946 [Mycena polygramma]|nr:hypothetical protein DFH06DRAFT_311946 [Mycena polygramma]
MLAALEADRLRIAQLQAQIAQLDLSLLASRNEKSLWQIAQLKLSLVGLRIEKFVAQVRLDSYKYPVSTLPTEIIIDIFICFLPTYPRIPPLRGHLSPALLTQICRRWREIALGTPGLWRALGLEIYEDAAPAREFRIWLNRSRCCPLSLKIARPSGLSLVNSEILGTIAHHCARLEYAELLLSTVQLPIIGGPHQAMPSLRELDLHLSIDSSDDPGITKYIFGDVPLLCTVTLNGLAASKVILPWAQLTSLTLCPVYSHECVSVLQQTPNLVFCKLRVFDSPGEQPGPDITLLYLESLTLLGHATGRATNFHESFIVPALRRLEIPKSHLRRKPIDSLTAFISKAGCTLESLHITHAKSVTATSLWWAFPAISNVSCYVGALTANDRSSLSDLN